MQTTGADSAGGGNRDEYIRSVANELMEKLPEEFDVYNIKKKFEIPVPTQTVLLQELDKFNILLLTMK